MTVATRYLDIGPGSKPAEGFETLDAHRGYNPTHVADARDTKLPSNTFDIVHASHIIEHIEWHEVKSTLKEWVRILKPGGTLEVWTVDATIVFKKIMSWEASGVWDKEVSTWQGKLTDGDPFLYWSGKLMNYNKAGQNGTLNFHRSIHTPRSLTEAMAQAGLVRIQAMDVETETRGHKHRMINMGFKGVKE